MNTTTEPTDIVPAGLLPVLGISYQKHIQRELKTLAPELGDLTRLTEREARLLEAAAEFSDQKAREDHESESRALRADPSPDNISRMKTLGSLDERMASYRSQSRALRAEVEKIQKEAMPPIEAISVRLSRRLGELALEAVAEESAVFKKWGLNVPPSRIADHFTRIRQELRNHTDQFHHGYFGGSISGWTKRFLGQA